MKKLLQSFLAFSLFGSALDAETRVVLTGASIQQQIDAAVDGDIIAIFGGTYNQDVVINKQVRLVEVSGQDVHITGSLTFSSVDGCPPFQGFKVGSPGKGITIDGTTGLVIQAVEIPEDGGSIEIINSSDVSIVEGTYTAISQKGGSLIVNSATILGNFETSESVVKTAAYRADVKGVCRWNADNSKAWFGYGIAKQFIHGGSNSKLTLVGSKVDFGGNTQSNQGTAVKISGANSNYTINNNILFGYQFSSPDPNRTSIIYSTVPDSSIVTIRNNYLQHSQRYYDYASYAIYFSRGPLQGVVSNNLYRHTTEYNYRGGSLVYAPFGITVSYNHIFYNKNEDNDRYGGIAAGGAAHTNTTVENSASLSNYVINNDPFETTNSVYLVDKGDPDPRYADRDGSRNDIGPRGGSWYDSEGRTTEKPVVISFGLAPEQVLGGVDNEVQIMDIEAISAP